MPQSPELVWLDNLTPKSTRFNDTYYTRESGIEESRYVFVDGNALAARWKSGEAPTIGELGFGTGLNFLVTWQAWMVAHANGATKDPALTFVSVEKYPLDRDSLAKALSPWEDIAPLADQLIGAWQPDAEGWQQLSLRSATLHLFIGDATDALSSMPMAIDAWFLDGFNPKTNPDLWSLDLMQAVADASNPNATLASYTAAGWVRRNLDAAGFAIAKRKGFGHKRDMITGTKR
ncbi:tRNA U34 5-methylaminomethyl-2-thiouridine-forming methyltransferase MnmC [Cohaesibacter sp. ES.047]|uniref:tRNA (5-methylaminomethyl-2-thiouridine)(34)-methyltransferase MnmD n=1 Tax=Cohaesibacter sp. ES.047 TaxID=1798205 RepID=UPI000BC036C4|nr:tRNA (5-methylaminomethyl-2-thiouridine)(34)-methyltransferase MnmD [Cohaesibacter sp. ES.047]SNY93462.1 tRNA U34 5-methylaminomethyl-2-thiouridine-forming methyltransferase MnmC [Cohaesibacter sp. ES.047]